VSQESEHRKLKNMLCLLQTMDEDGDPDNGIQISPELAKVSGFEIDFDKEPEDFAYDEGVSKLLKVAPKAWVSEDDALDHFKKTINGLKQAHGEFKKRRLAMSSKGDWFNEHDLDGSGNLSEDEFVSEAGARLLGRWKLRFVHLDKDGSGLIEQGEWPHEQYQDRFGQALQKLFDQADGDGDGALSLAELGTLASSALGLGDEELQNFAEAATAAFQLLDLDDSGALDQSELLGGAKGAILKAIDDFKFAQEGDASIEELLPTDLDPSRARVLASLTEADQNDDGMISMSEVDAVLFAEVVAAVVGLLQGQYDNLPPYWKHKCPSFGSVDSDGSLSIDEAEWTAHKVEQHKSHQQQLFAKIDADQDGLLTLVELEDHEGAYRHGSHQHRAKLIERFDLDGDGQLSEDEFISDLDEVYHSQASAHFTAMDANGDGFLQKSEMKVSPQRDAKERKQDKFEQQDQDGDGSLNREEFLDKVADKHQDRAKEHFEAMDENQDGLLSMDELKVLKKRKK
jgi:Ca2+-binding EF-hand superfamily protein